MHECGVTALWLVATWRIGDWWLGLLTYPHGSEVGIWDPTPHHWVLEALKTGAHCMPIATPPHLFRSFFLSFLIPSVNPAPLLHQMLLAGLRDFRHHQVNLHVDIPIPN